MADLIIRNVDPQLLQSLQEHALRHGHSMEEERLHILRQALGEPQSFKQALASIPNVGNDQDFARIPQGTCDA